MSTAVRVTPPQAPCSCHFPKPRESSWTCAGAHEEDSGQDMLAMLLQSLHPEDVAAGLDSSSRNSPPSQSLQ